MPNFPPTNIIELHEVAEPAAPPADKLKLYVVDQNGYSVLEVKGETGYARRLSPFIVAKVDEDAGVGEAKAVYLSGAAGANELIKLAKADDIATMPACGLTIDAGAKNEFVRVLVFHKLGGFAPIFSAGDLVYVSDTDAGELVNVKPSYPSVVQRVGMITRDVGFGEILLDLTRVKEQESYNDLKDVPATFPPEAHNIDSHDTEATGLELDELTGGGLTALHSHAGGAGGNYGQAIIPFADWLVEDSITVADAGIQANSKILASVYADNDDVYAQDWFEPVIRNVVVGVGFDILIRPSVGTFKGSVKVNWTWN